MSTLGRCTAKHNWHNPPARHRRSSDYSFLVSRRASVPGISEFESSIGTTIEDHSRATTTALTCPTSWHPPQQHVAIVTGRATGACGLASGSAKILIILREIIDQKEIIPVFHTYTYPNLQVLVSIRSSFAYLMVVGGPAPRKIYGKKWQPAPERERER